MVALDGGELYRLLIDALLLRLFVPVSAGAQQRAAQAAMTMSLVFIIMYFWFVLIGGRTARFGYTRFLFRVKFRAFPPPRQFVDEVAQDVHVVDECLVARRIRVFAGLLAVVREPFGGHPIKSCRPSAGNSRRG